MRQRQAIPYIALALAVACTSERRTQRPSEPPTIPSTSGSVGEPPQTVAPASSAEATKPLILTESKRSGFRYKNPRLVCAIDEGARILALVRSATLVAGGEVFFRQYLLVNADSGEVLERFTWTSPSAEPKCTEQGILWRELSFHAKHAPRPESPSEAEASDGVGRRWRVDERRVVGFEPVSEDEQELVTYALMLP
ncbi:MAG: hypothetical protein AB7K71_02930 [Polyangiaceae bacterium]